MEILVVVLACLIPIMSVIFFVIGYNMHAPKKMFHISKKKSYMTQDEELMDRLEKAHF